MNYRSLAFLTTLIFALWGVLGIQLRAQSESEEEFDSPFKIIENPQLRKACLTLERMDYHPLEKNEGETELQFQARVAERLRLPENQQAITTILKYIETPDLDAWPKGMDAETVAFVIRLAVKSGSETHLPQLKKLAHHPDRLIRDAVASPDAYAYLQDPSMDLLKECLRSAEERLPKDLKDENATQAAFDEFEYRIGTFTRYARVQSRRDEARPFMERFYKRYGWKAKRFYEPRFKRDLKGEVQRIEPYDPKKAGAQAARRKAWTAAIWVGSAAFLAMVWWFVRKRMRRASAP